MEKNWRHIYFFKNEWYFEMMKHTYLLTISLLFLVLINVTGCETIWNCRNKWALKKDIVELFKKHGVMINDPVCEMRGTNREATCEFRAAADQVSSIVRDLNLKRVEWKDVLKNDNSLSKGSPSENRFLSCRSSKNVAKMRVYISGRWPSELRLENGSAFKYLILFQDLDTEKVCVQVSYSYG